jgi:hypothetical protein
VRVLAELAGEELELELVELEELGKQGGVVGLLRSS